MPWIGSRLVQKFISLLDAPSSYSGQALKIPRVNSGETALEFVTNLGIPIVTAGGTVDAITADYTPNVTLANLTLVAFIATAANTTTTPTFAPDGLTAYTIVKKGGNALVVGDIAGAGFVAIVEYNLANTRWELLNPAKIVDADVAAAAAIAYSKLNLALGIVNADVAAAAAIAYSKLATTGVPSVDGVKFPATQVPSADANTLDDYEEGTWTPELKLGGASVGMTYNAQVGQYTKIGKMVHVTFRVSLAAKGTSIGSATVTGLPFNNVVTNPAIIFYPAYALVGLTAGGAMIGFIDATILYLLLQTTTASAAMTDANFGNSSDFRGGISYFI